MMRTCNRSNRQLHSWPSHPIRLAIPTRSGGLKNLHDLSDVRAETLRPLTLGFSCPGIPSCRVQSQFAPDRTTAQPCVVRRFGVTQTPFLLRCFLQECRLSRLRPRPRGASPRSPLKSSRKFHHCLPNIWKDHERGQSSDGIPERLCLFSGGKLIQRSMVFYLT